MANELEYFFLILLASQISFFESCLFLIGLLVAFCEWIFEVLCIELLSTCKKNIEDTL
jgi:hypothetical protein